MMFQNAMHTLHRGCDPRQFTQLTRPESVGGPLYGEVVD